MSNDIHETDMEELFNVIQILSRQFNVLLRHSLPCHNINSVECSILYELKNSAPISLNDLAELIGLEVSTASRYVQKLVEGGLVERKTSPHDRRVTLLSVSESGKKLSAAVIQSMIDYLPETFDRISKERLIALCEDLLVIARKLKE